MTTIVLDLTGLKCPLPVLRTRKALVRLRGGDRLEVTCTDPLAAIDIPALVQSIGCTLCSASENKGTLIFVIERAPEMPA